MLALALTGGLAGPGCGSDGQDCGLGNIASVALTATIAEESVKYDDFTSSPNNDCPAPEGGPTSLTVDGKQADPGLASPRFLTFCLPRPGQIDGSPIALPASDRIQVIAANAQLANNCTLELDSTGTPSGTIRFLGYCKDGVDPAGYAIELAGSLPGIKKCPSGVGGGTIDEPVTIELSGTSAVAAINL